MADENTEPQGTPDPGNPDAEETAGTETEVPTTAESVNDEVEGDGTDSQVEPDDDPDSVADKPLWQTPMFWAAIVLSVLLLITVSLLVSFLMSRDKTIIPPAGIAEIVLESTPTVVVPAVPKGISSWTNYTAAATPEMWESLQKLYPDRDVRSEAASLAASETRGASYVVEVPLGTSFINTSYHKGGPKYHFFRDSLGEATHFLTFTDGTVAVKMKCGNSARLLGNIRCKKVIIRKPTSRPRKGVKGPDTTLGAARQSVGDGNAVRTTTPSYSGSGDTVATEQNSTAGSISHNDVGHAGSGAGGTTPPATNSSGESNSGSGATDTNPVSGVTTPATGDPGQPQ